MTALSGDKALTEAGSDRLGYAATAEAIAIALLGQPVIDGLVVGIEGKWGSGKSSLVNMTVAALRASPPDRAPQIVEFRPWLIGDRDELMLALFTELAIAVDGVEEGAGDPVGRRHRDVGETGKKIVGFAAQLGGLGALAKVAGAIVPGATLAGEAVEAIAKAAQGIKGQRSMAAEKADLRERLSSLPRPIVVTIDDVDRLEPAEVVEILRLVRSVADFPKVAYVLCYDPAIVSRSIERAAHIDDGRAYIEKIVQVTVPVPRPESFDLRRWFGQGVDALPGSADEAGSWRSRLDAAVDHDGGRYLTTPRHVVRCLDGLRFVWGALAGRVDLADLVWLHLVKVGNPRLYDWIEAYLEEASAKASGLAIVTDEQKRRDRAILDEILLAEGESFATARYRLSELLPGIDLGMSSMKDDEAGIYSDVSREAMACAARSLRLASPDHHRLYFAAQQPRNAPRRSDFVDLFAALDTSAASAAELLAQWNRTRLSTGATKAEAMLARLVGLEGEAIGGERGAILLAAFGNQMDELADVRPEGMADPQAWVEGRRVLRWLLPQFDGRRLKALEAMFRGKSIDWLTTLLRNDTFAHGRVEANRHGEAFLEAAELDRVTEIMVERYRRLDIDGWKKSRRPSSALFAWLQAGDSDGPPAMVQRVAATDGGLLDVLELMGGRTSSSDRGDYVSLKESTLRYFLDYADARARTDAIARDASDASLRERAKRLKEQFRNGERF